MHVCPPYFKRLDPKEYYCHVYFLLLRKPPNLVLRILGLLGTYRSTCTCLEAIDLNN